MTEPLGALEAARQALRESEKPGGCAHTLGTPTTGHHCQTCGGDNVEAADQIALTDRGPSVVAVWFHCPDCDMRGGDAA